MTESSQEVGGHPSTRGEDPRTVSIHRTFVVRLYADDGAGGGTGGAPGRLAGRVEHVPTREEASFSTVEELVAFLRSRGPSTRGGRPCA